MNERIKELYGPAYKFAKENCVQNIDDLGNNYFKLFHEKFAELIVRECAEQVKNLRVNDYGSSGADIIREHFGVEV
jgi:hypothetical protein